jgi:hypothetical protein
MKLTKLTTLAECACSWAVEFAYGRQLNGESDTFCVFHICGNISNDFKNVLAALPKESYILLLLVMKFLL